MSTVVILLLASLSVSGFFLICFLWSVKDGQLDDIESPKHRIILDSDKHKILHHDSRTI